MVRRTSALLMIVMCSGLCFGQSVGRSDRTSGSQIERLIEEAAAEGQETSLLDVLTRLRENPLDINTAASEELQQLPGLDLILAGRIAEHRSQGSFKSVMELLQVEGIDEILLAELEPFVTVRAQSSRESGYSSVVTLRTRLARSASDVTALTSDGFLGSPEKVYSRLTARVVRSTEATPDERKWKRSEPSLAFGLLTEKDPGEPSLLDCVSGHIMVAMPNSGVKFIVGDFGMDAAHGEVFSSSSNYSIGSEVIRNAGRTREGLRPSLSSESSGNFRGLAGSLVCGALSLSLFTSTRQLDARVDSSGLVTGWSAGGYHRTEHELKTKHQVKENTIGGRTVVGIAEGFSLGFSGYNLKFNRDLHLSGISQPQPNENFVGGVDLAFNNTVSSISAEIAYRGGKIDAGEVRFSWVPGRAFATALFVRICNREKYSATISGESENDKHREIYTAVRLKPSPWLMISALYDRFHFPGSTSSSVLPASSHEFLVMCELWPTRLMHLELRYRHKTRPAQETLSSPSHLLARADGAMGQSQARAALTFNVSDWFQWRSRMEFVEVRRLFLPNVERGFMMYEDLSFDAFRNLSFSLRGIAFETPSYDSRIYEFEEDVPGAFQNPALYGRGFRGFFRGQFECGTWLACSLKCALTQLLGSNQSETQAGRTRSRRDVRWSIQMDLRW